MGTITDMEPETFDQVLAYIHTGFVTCTLDLTALAKILLAANKYLLKDLVAWSLLRILNALEDSERMLREDVTTLAELLTFSELAAVSCPTLQKKLIESVLTHRRDVIQDERFLAHAASKSTGALAKLLAPFHSAHDDDDDSMRKRRKVKPDVASTVWQEEWGYVTPPAPSWSVSAGVD